MPVPVATLIAPPESWNAASETVSPAVSERSLHTRKHVAIVVSADG